MEQVQDVSAAAVMDELNALADAQKAVGLSRFFKTGNGEYGEGDIFIGVSVPMLRKIARRVYRSLPLDQVAILLKSSVHEHRMTALLMLVYVMKSRLGTEQPERYAAFFLDHIERVNNWDLVDTSCLYILGPWLADRNDRSVLYELAASGDLWKQRIAMITTLFFIRQNDFHDTLKIADMLLDHPHDLIHKAVGWMIREVGNRDGAVEREFLRSRYTRMPRTMLRYAIEKFPEDERQAYIHGEVPYANERGG